MIVVHHHVSRLGAAGAPLAPRIDSKLANHLGDMDGSLQGREQRGGPYAMAE